MMTLDRWRGQPGVMGWLTLRWDVKMLKLYAWWISLAVLLLLPGAAQAQSLREISSRPYYASSSQRTPEQQQQIDHQNLDALNHATWFYVGTAAADWSVTAVCARVLCGDRTQTGLFLHGVERPAWSIPLGLAIDAGTVWTIRAFIAPDYPKAARVLLYGLGGARLIFVTNKVTDLRDRTVRR